MYLHDALNQLTDEHQAGNDKPDEWLRARQKLLEHIRQCWRRGLIVIRGREWTPVGPFWNDRAGIAGPAEDITWHDDMHFAWEGDSARLLYLYRQADTGGGRLEYPTASWRELAITDDDFVKLKPGSQLPPMPQPQEMPAVVPQNDKTEATSTSKPPGDEGEAGARKLAWGRTRPKVLAAIETYGKELSTIKTRGRRAKFIVCKLCGEGVACSPSYARKILQELGR